MSHTLAIRGLMNVPRCIKPMESSYIGTCNYAQYNVTQIPVPILYPELPSFVFIYLSKQYSVVKFSRISSINSKKKQFVWPIRSCANFKLKRKKSIKMSYE